MSYARKYNVDKNQLALTYNNPAGERKWYVFYLRPRTENKVCSALTKLNHEVFLPVIETIRIWKNRQKKKILLPLFPGYLFVYTCAHELYPIKRLPHVISYVTCGGKPATISEKEINGIRRMLGMGYPVSVETKFSKRERVRIASGPLKGYEGILIRQHGKTRFGIHLKAISHTVFIDITRDELEKL